MKIITILRVLKGLFDNRELSLTNIIRNLRINRFVSIETEKAFFVCGRESDIRIERNSNIALRSRFSVGQKYLSKTHYRSWLWIMKGGKLDVNGAFVLHEGASIHIHEGGHLILWGGYFNENVSVVCESVISIGEGASIAPGVVIRDCDSHEIVDAPSAKPITIGKHVWIGTNAIILKGVAIGDGAVIGAGAVVTKDVPSNCVVAGNPARVVKGNIIWK